MERNVRRAAQVQGKPWTDLSNYRRKIEKTIDEASVMTEFDYQNISRDSALMVKTPVPSVVGKMRITAPPVSGRHTVLKRVR